MTTIDDATLELLATGSHAAPHDLLGAHPEGDDHVVRVVRRLATTVDRKSVV